MSKIQISTISQAIELLNKAKREYKELEKETISLRQENKLFKETLNKKNKLPPGFDELFKGFGNK
jgi:cell shape-determining protein MreC